LAALGMTASSASGERLSDVLQARADPVKRHDHVVQQIGGFFHSALPGSVGKRGDELRALLSDFLESKIAIRQETTSVARLPVVRRRSALTNSSIELAQRVEMCVTKTRKRSRMTCRPGRNHAREHSVAIAVSGKRNHSLHVSTRSSLVPKPARPRAKMH